MDGYRIVQISDLHNAKFGQNNEKLIRKIAGLEPDMIVVTGDLVDSNHTDLDVAIHFMESVTQICPVYYVTGNHEYWLDDRSLSDGTLSSLVQDCDSDCLRVVLAHEPQYIEKYRGIVSEVHGGRVSNGQYDNVCEQRTRKQRNSHSTVQ